MGLQTTVPSSRVRSGAVAAPPQSSSGTSRSSSDLGLSGSYVPAQAGVDHHIAQIETARREETAARRVVKLRHAPTRLQGHEHALHMDLGEFTTGLNAQRTARLPVHRAREDPVALPLIAETVRPTATESADREARSQAVGIHTQWIGEPRQPLAVAQVRPAGIDHQRLGRKRVRPRSFHELPGDRVIVGIHQEIHVAQVDAERRIAVVEQPLRIEGTVLVKEPHVAGLQVQRDCAGGPLADQEVSAQREHVTHREIPGVTMGVVDIPQIEVDPLIPLALPREIQVVAATEARPG